MSTPQEVSWVLGRAAQGDIEARAEMLERMVGTATHSGSVCPESLAIIEIWARMLATHGRAQDKVRLVGVLIFKASAFQFSGRQDLAGRYIDEGVQLFRKAAEQGHAGAETQAAAF